MNRRVIVAVYGHDTGFKVTGDVVANIPPSHNMPIYMDEGDVVTLRLESDRLVVVDSSKRTRRNRRRADKRLRARSDDVNKEWQVIEGTRVVRRPRPDMPQHVLFNRARWTCRKVDELPRGTRVRVRRIDDETVEVRVGLTGEWFRATQVDANGRQET